MRQSSNYIKTPRWDDPQKVNSRSEAIILPYHRYFSNAIPQDKQYWTMCGAHFNEQGRLEGEFGHLTREGLIQPNQFNGVDIEPSIIDTNRQYYPDVNWHCGDFRDVMSEAVVNGNFNPAIINYDGVMQSKRGAKYLKRILSFIDHNVNDDLMLVANFLLNSPYQSDEGTPRETGGEAIDKLLSIYIFPDHWSIHPTYYEYPGTDKRSKSWMGMFIFIKKSHKQVVRTANRRLDCIGA